MKINQVKPLVLALSLSLVFAGCDNNSTNPDKEAKQSEQVETTTEAEDKTNEEVDQKDTEENKEEKSEANGSLKDGTYKASANGYDRELNLEVTIAGGKISDIELLENH